MSRVSDLTPTERSRTVFIDDRIYICRGNNIIRVK